MSLLTWVLGIEPHAIVTGVSDDEETGGLRMYIGPRYKGVYAIVMGEAEKAELERLWSNNMQQIVVPTPPSELLFTDEERP